jgi:hypothetical protein
MRRTRATLLAPLLFLVGAKADMVGERECPDQSRVQHEGNEAFCENTERDWKGQRTGPYILESSNLRVDGQYDRRGLRTGIWSAYGPDRELQARARYVGTPSQVDDDYGGVGLFLPEMTEHTDSLMEQRILGHSLLATRLSPNRPDGEGVELDYSFVTSSSGDEHEFVFDALGFYVRFDKGAELVIKGKEKYVTRLDNWRVDRGGGANRVHMWFDGAGILLEVNGVRVGPVAVVRSPREIEHSAGNGWAQLGRSWAEWGSGQQYQPSERVPLRLTIRSGSLQGLRVRPWTGSTLDIEEATLPPWGPVYGDAEGVLHGDAEWFHSDDQVAVSGEFWLGSPVGEWTAWREDGSLLQWQSLDRDGFIELSVEWDERGRATDVQCRDESCTKALLARCTEDGRHAEVCHVGVERGLAEDLERFAGQPPEVAKSRAVALATFQVLCESEHRASCRSREEVHDALVQTLAGAAMADARGDRLREFSQVRELLSASLASDVEVAVTAELSRRIAELKTVGDAALMRRRLSTDSVQSWADTDSLEAHLTTLVEGSMELRLSTHPVDLDGVVSLLHSYEAMGWDWDLGREGPVRERLLERASDVVRSGSVGGELIALASFVQGMRELGGGAWLDEQTALLRPAVEAQLAATTDRQEALELIRHFESLLGPDWRIVQLVRLLKGSPSETETEPSSIAVEAPPAQPEPTAALQREDERRARLGIELEMRVNAQEATNRKYTVQLTTPIACDADWQGALGALQVEIEYLASQATQAAGALADEAQELGVLAREVRDLQIGLQGMGVLAREARAALQRDLGG